MSGLVNKVKDALHSDKDKTHTDSHHNTTTGAHTTGTHTTGTHTTTGAAAPGLDNRGVSGPAPGTDGPHGSNMMNKADPRVDSDRDHSRNMGANSAGNARTDNLHTSAAGSGLHSSGAAPVGAAGGLHSSTGGAGGLHGTPGAHTGTHGTTGVTGGAGGLHGTHGAHTGTHGTTGVHGGAGLDNRGVGGPAPGTDGPHGSNMMNKADPRVDSDRDHSRNMGANPSGNARTDNLHSGAGATGLHGATGTHGAHGTHGTTGTHGTAGTFNSSGPGPAPGTAGPHKSDMMNKADPRVDSNLDGSKTVGGDKTFAQNDANLAHKDPTDAAQVPPSVLQKTKGPPEVHHDDSRHSRERRHGSVSHQEHGHGL